MGCERSYLVEGWGKAISNKCLLSWISETGQGQWRRKYNPVAIKRMDKDPDTEIVYI